MGINANDLRKLDTELAPFVQALKDGKTVEVYEGEHERWCETKQLHTYRDAADYRVV